MSIYLGSSEPSKIYVGSNEVSAVFVGTQQVRPALPIPSSGLLGYRPLQSDLKDTSGNGKDGSWYSGTGTFSTAAGKTGARVTWDSNKRSTQHVITSLAYDSNPITVCGWICYNSSVQTGSGAWTGLMTTCNAAGKGATIGTRPADHYYPYSTVGGGTVRVNNAMPTTNTWYFWCATCDGTTIKTYYNGTQYTTGTAGTITTGGNWLLGCVMIDRGQTLNNGTDGWVRHCAVYNRALTDAEVLQIYNQTK